MIAAHVNGETLRFTLDWGLRCYSTGGNNFSPEQLVYMLTKLDRQFSTLC